MRVILINTLLLLIIGCSHTISTAPHSVSAYNSALGMSIYTNSRFNINDIESVKFCNSVEVENSTYIIIKFDCDFSVEKIDYLNANLTLALDSLFGALIRDNRLIWITEYDWCIYIVQGVKGYNVSSKTNSCISFYISESVLDGDSDLNSPNLKSTLSFIRTMLHEGFHVHSLKTNVNKAVDLFLFEVKAYLISEYINIYSKYIFDVEIQDYESDISIDDRQYLLENCKSEKNLEKLLLVNKGGESFLAYTTVNLLLLDIEANLGVAPIYIDFILEQFSRHETKTLDIFSFIISCNPTNSNIIEALRSATLDYDFANEILNFPTTNYFLNNAYASNGKEPQLSLAQCSHLKKEVFPYYTCLSNFIDIAEVFRLSVDLTGMLESIPSVFTPRVEHVLIENSYKSKELLEYEAMEVFEFDEESKYYTNNLGYIADTASALNINLRLDCLDDGLNIVTKAIDIFSKLNVFSFCGFHSHYGGSWIKSDFAAGLLGSHVNMRPNNIFINTNVPSTPKIVEIPFTFQGGLPVVQMIDGNGVTLNGCIDSGSVFSYSTRRYDLRLINTSDVFLIDFKHVNAPLSILIGPLRRADDSVLHCDLILGTDFLSIFPFLLVKKGKIEFMLPEFS